MAAKSEAEYRWDSTNDSTRMLRWLLEWEKTDQGYNRCPRATDRKLRLFGVACCRAIWPLLTEEVIRDGLGIAEMMADHRASAQEMDVARGQARLAAARLATSTAQHWAADAVAMLLHPGEERGYELWLDPFNVSLVAELCVTASLTAAEEWVSPEPFYTVHANLLRCIMGNPFEAIPDFRPVEHSWGTQIDPILAWDGGKVAKMAARIYEERDWAALPVLADALEDAGCVGDAMLAHLRAPCPYCKDADFATSDGGFKTGAKMRAALNKQCRCRGSRVADHTRGCWVLDCLLGKE